MVRKTRRPLTRERVLKAAIKLADRNGLGALSMRRLGTELGVEAMSLYRYFDSKEALLNGMAEQLFTEISGAVAERPPALTANWKSDLRSRCLTARSVVMHHAWTPALLAERQSIPFAMYAYIDRIVALLVEAGFSYSITHRALHALGSLPFGFVQELFSPPSSGGKLDVDAAPNDFTRIAALLPNLSAMVASEIHQTLEPTIGWCDSQTEFEFTVDLLLDGLERIRDSDGVQ